MKQLIGSILLCCFFVSCKAGGSAAKSELVEKVQAESSKDGAYEQLQKAKKLRDALHDQLIDDVNAIQP